MSLDWRRTIAEMAKAEPDLRFTTLAHHITPELLEAAYRSLNKKTVAGPDGVTIADYSEGLDDRIEELWLRLREGRWRSTPALRVWIPKPNGKMRPLAVPNVEDRIVQKAIALVLEPIYETDFESFSYGFRPGRSTKDALEHLRQTVHHRPVDWVFEADISGFFDNLDHEWIRKFLAHRIGDRSLLRLIGKVLKSGVVEDGRVQRSKKGTPQGGPLSPLLANIFLHYVLDIWFSRRVSPKCQGAAGETAVGAAKLIR